MIKRMTVLFFLSRKKTNKAGLAPVWCRITIHGQREQFSTGQWVRPDQWDMNKKKIIDDESELKQFALDSIKHRLNVSYFSCVNAGAVTTYHVMKHYRQGDEPPMLFSTLAEKWIEYRKKQVEKKEIDGGTARRDQRMIEVMTIWLQHTGRRNIPAVNITGKIASEYMDYLDRYRWNAHYKRKHLQAVRQALLWASGLELIEIYPLAGYITRQARGAWKKKKKTWLTREELQVIHTYDFPVPTIRVVADVFLFMCYTGMDYADMKVFRKETIEHGYNTAYFLYQRRKTVNTGTVVLMKEAVDILNKYGGTLPVSSNKTMNIYVKVVAALCGITKHLTTRVARKTCNQLLVYMGVDREQRAAFLGHSVEINEEYYTDITPEVVIQAIKPDALFRPGG